MGKTSVKPLGENVLIKPEKQEKRTDAGIYLPENSSEERPQQGKIVAIGDNKDIKVKNGQKIIFNRFSGTEVKIDGEEYLLIKNEDILAIVE